MQNGNKKIVVLKGGESKESEISYQSARSISRSLRKLGYIAVEIEADKEVAINIKKENPDIVFNAMHGLFGEDGCIAGLLEIMQIPYTHSGVFASSIAMNKVKAKIILNSVDITCPSGTSTTGRFLKNFQNLKTPFVIKPNQEGSSVGINIIKNDSDFKNAISDYKEDDPILIEKYIEGRELTALVLGSKVIDVLEIIPKEESFYNFKAKYEKGQSEYQIPADIPKKIYEEVKRKALKAHFTLGCKDISRSDFIYNEEEGLFFLELNTHPGMTESSLTPKIAAYNGIEFEDIVKFLVQNAGLKK